MARIFISHSSENTEDAISFGRWLSESGFDDYFLDAHRSKGLQPGQRWQEALKAAADRCEAVVFLISPAWRNSKWCVTEFLLAKQLGKAIFCVLIEPTSLDSLPVELTSELQLADWVTRPEEGKEKLKAGLKAAGLDASTFLWPPPSEPEREPYRGLGALQESDSAVMFGREADTVRGLDELRLIRDLGDQRLLAVLGASGAGKSSFLRAGLWPRLKRDTRHFFPLPIIRPARYPLSGEYGLAASLESVLAAVGKPEMRGTIVDKISKNGASALANYLERIEAGLATELHFDHKPPAIVLAIDQCEELFSDSALNEDERDVLVHAIAPLLANQNPDKFPIAARRLICVTTIRSDTYELLQLDPDFTLIGRRTFDLSPIHTGSYRSIIEGPANRSTEGGKRLEIDPELTEQLLKDTVGKDALPLLGFTLQRLYSQYGADGDLLLSEYKKLGGVQGSITAAVEDAIENAGNNGLDPAADPIQLLRETFLPRLVKIAGRFEPPLRQIADLQDLPMAARPLIDAFVDSRLLRYDRRSSSTTVEVAHEALLRQWPSLSAWLDDERETLRVLGNVQAAAHEYQIRNDAEDDTDAWLIHLGKRLEMAESMLSERRYYEALGLEGQNYLADCRALQNQVDEGERLRVKTEKSKQRRKYYWCLFFLGWIMIFVLGMALLINDLYFTNSVATKSSDGKSIAIINGNNATFWRNDTGEQWQRFRLDEHTQSINAIATLANSTSVITASSDYTMRVWQLEPGKAAQASVLESDTTSVRQIVASRTGDRFVAVHDSLFGLASVTVWEMNVDNKWQWYKIYEHDDSIFSVAITGDGSRFVTGSDDDTARVWYEKSNGKWDFMLLEGHTDSVIAVYISDDGKTVVTGSHDYTARIWQEGQNKQWTSVQLIGHSDYIQSIHSSPNSEIILTTSDDHTARVWSRDSRNIWQSTPLIGHSDQVRFADISKDRTQLLTASDDGTVRIWRIGAGTWIPEIIDQHEKEVRFVSFLNDNRSVFSASIDGVGHLLYFDFETGWQRAEFFSGCSALPCE